ncbi:alpha/beta fold hydrolase [Sorangium sp. So ce542]|uniref:alpha/beta hydrolase family protein n=1 Tax=Sorangium sp. So ce542 TaxID=3133316 RepID=UPI003F61B6F1
MSLRSSLLVPARRAALVLSCAVALAGSPFGVGCGAGEAESSAGGDGALPDEAEQPPAPDTPPCPEAATSVDLTVENAYGTLEGTLEVPAGCGPFPSVVILPGSGPTDRDGNQAAAGIAADTYRLLAEGLRDRGIASIRYDKAGIGGSASAAPRSEQEMRFEMGADDAVLWVKALRGDGRFATVAVVGHSEGSLLGMLAAQAIEVDGYVSIAGAGRPIGEVLRDQLAGLPDEDRERAYEILGRLEAGELVEDVPKTELFLSLFRPSVQPYIISWMKHDPAVELAAVKAPVLLLQGTADIQVGVQEAERLAGARPDARLVLIEGMSHTLKAATLSSASQQAAYTDPSLPVVPRVLEEIGALLRAE